MINKIIENQKELQVLVDEHKYEFKNDDDMIFKYMSAINGEVEEVKQEINWKWWKQPKEICTNKVKEELADIFIFWLDLITRLDYNDIWEVIQNKQEINIKRQQGLVPEKIDYKKI